MNELSEQMQAALLQSIKSDLDHIIKPKLEDKEAINAAVLASDILAHLLCSHHLSETLNVTKRKMTDVVTRAQAELKKYEYSEIAAPSQPSVGSELYNDPIYTKLKIELSQSVVNLLNVSTANVSEREKLRQLIRSAIEIEVDLLREEKSVVDISFSERSHQLQDVEKPIDITSLKDFAAKQLHAYPVGDIEHTERIAGGYSKDTWKVKLTGTLAGYSNLILRRDLPFGPGENTVLDEYQLLMYLASSGLPVPEPLWVEPKRQFVGEPFLLFPELAGSAVFGEWEEDPKIREAVIFDIARCLAKLHSLDYTKIEDLPESVLSGEPEEAIRGYVNQWRDRWIRNRSHPSSILEVAFDWLLRNVPSGLDHLSIIHGDVTFRNTLIENGKLVAILDWEFWHLGDPIEDLSYFRLVAEPYTEWEKVMSVYQDAGGIKYDRDRERYFSVWRSVRNSVTTATAWRGFLQGLYPATKSAFQGVSLYRFFLRDVAEQLSKVSI